MIDENELKEEFLKLESKFRHFAGTLKTEIEDALRSENIGFITVDYRLKSWDSFLDKLKRKNYTSPLKDIKDMCGFRIVIRDSADIEKIIKVINREFKVEESVDKNDDLDADKFGYRSYHMIIGIKKEWMSVPRFRDSKNLKIEIQIRSELMNAWANISHMIFYKKESNPKEISRRLFRLSALMEIADSEISQIIANQPIQIKKKKVKDLQEILDEYLPNRKRALEKPLAELIEDMQNNNFEFETLVHYLESKMDKLLEIEEEAFSDKSNNVESRWWQTGFVYGIMFLTNEDYWRKEGIQYSQQFVSTIEKHREAFLK